MVKRHSLQMCYLTGIYQVVWYNWDRLLWRLGGAVTQLSAKPRRWVQLPQVPPHHN